MLNVGSSGNASGEITAGNVNSSDNCSLLVSLPLLVSYGAVIKQDSSSSAVYVFPPQYPSARALFARSMDTCDMFVGQLQVDLVSFCCRKSQVAQVASVFTRMARKKLEPQFKRPIYIRCEGLKQRTTSNSTSGVITHDIFTGGGQQRVYFTAVDILTQEDRERFWAVERFVETYVDKLKDLKLINLKSVTRTPDLFVVVRRFLNDPPTRPLSFYSQYACEGVQLSEVRLVFSKGTSQCPVKHLKIDPRFKTNEISCRPIVCDSDGRPARQEFSQPILPLIFPSTAAALAYFSMNDSEKSVDDNIADSRSLQKLILNDDDDDDDYNNANDYNNGNDNDEGSNVNHCCDNVLPPDSATASQSSLQHEPAIIDSNSSYLAAASVEMESAVSLTKLGPERSASRIGIDVVDGFSSMNKNRQKNYNVSSEWSTTGGQLSDHTEDLDGSNFYLPSRNKRYTSESKNINSNDGNSLQRSRSSIVQDDVSVPKSLINTNVSISSYYSSVRNCLLVAGSGGPDVLCIGDGGNKIDTSCHVQGLLTAVTASRQKGNVGSPASGDSFINSSSDSGETNSKSINSAFSRQVRNLSMWSSAPSTATANSTRNLGASKRILASPPVSVVDFA